MTGSILEARNFSVRLAGRTVIENLSVGFRSGELVGLVGPNGVGKSTLLRGLRGLFRTGGEVRIAGGNVAALDPAERARMIAYVPQWPVITWPVPAGRLVALGRRPFMRGLFSQLRGNDRAAVERAMKRMGVEHLAGRLATRLSCGEKARVLIARALARETPVLLADEPTAGLDPAHQVALMKSFRSFAEEGHLVIAALHDLGLAARWCTRLVLLDHGGIVADGPPREVLKQKNLSDVYGVKAYLGQAAGGPVVEFLDTVHD